MRGEREVIPRLRHTASPISALSFSFSSYSFLKTVNSPKSSALAESEILNKKKR